MSDSALLRVVYLAGTGYSGSTLLSFLLNAHPEVVSIGELPSRRWETPDFECSCGKSLMHCPFFQQIAGILREQGLAFDINHMDLLHRYTSLSPLNRLLLGSLRLRSLTLRRDRILAALPSSSARLRHYIARNEAFVEAALSVARAQVFLDASKVHYRIPLLRQSQRFKLKIIHLLRDPRAQVHSALRHHPELSVQAAAASWIRVHRAIEWRRADFAAQDWLRLKYEDFCADPELHYGRLCAFIGIASQALPNDFRQPPHHIIGNPMRSSVNPGTRIRTDMRWKEEMPPVDQRRVMLRVHRVAHHYGYVDDS